MNSVISSSFFFLKNLYSDLCVMLFEDDEYEDQEDVFEEEDENHGYYNGYDDDDYQNPDSDYEDE